jgi:hypothetical protein
MEMAMGYQAVLLSGGYESIGCLLRALEEHPRTDILCYFFEYGQPYLKEERAAVMALQKKFGFVLSVIKLTDMTRRSKVFKNRNEIFIRTVASDMPDGIWFGCRAPLPMFDPYKDSNWLFAKRLGKQLGVKIHTPFIMIPDFLIKSLVYGSGVDQKCVYSSKGYVYENK